MEEFFVKINFKKYFFINSCNVNEDVKFIYFSDIAHCEYFIFTGLNYWPFVNIHKASCLKTYFHINMNLFIDLFIYSRKNYLFISFHYKLSLIFLPIQLVFLFYFHINLFFIFFNMYIFLILNFDIDNLSLLYIDFRSLLSLNSFIFNLEIIFKLILWVFSHIYFYHIAMNLNIF